MLRKGPVLSLIIYERTVKVIYFETVLIIFIMVYQFGFVKASIITIGFRSYPQKRGNYDHSNKPTHFMNEKWCRPGKVSGDLTPDHFSFLL
jgi:hypothetical protein